MDRYIHNHYRSTSNLSYKSRQVQVITHISRNFAVIPRTVPRQMQVYWNVYTPRPTRALVLYRRILTLVSLLLKTLPEDIASSRCGAKVPGYLDYCMFVYLTSWVFAAVTIVLAVDMRYGLVFVLLFEQKGIEALLVGCVYVHIIHRYVVLFWRKIFLVFCGWMICEVVGWNFRYFMYLDTFFFLSFFSKTIEKLIIIGKTIVILTRMKRPLGVLASKLILPSHGPWEIGTPPQTVSS